MQKSKWRMRRDSDLVIGEVDAITQIAEFFEDAFFIPSDDVLSELPETKRHGDGAAESVSIGAHMAHHDETLFGAEQFGDFFE